MEHLICVIPAVLIKHPLTNSAHCTTNCYKDVDLTQEVDGVAVRFVARALSLFCSMSVCFGRGLKGPVRCAWLKGVAVLPKSVLAPIPLPMNDLPLQNE